MNKIQTKIASAVCSGFGQFHTHEQDASKPNKNLTPYDTISFNEIKGMVDNPQQVDKAKAQWLIPSNLLSRSFKTQEAKGNYWLLWVDIDANLSPINLVEEHLLLSPVVQLRDKGWPIVNHESTCMTNDIVPQRTKFSEYELFAEFSSELQQRVEKLIEAVVKQFKSSATTSE